MNLVCACTCKVHSNTHRFTDGHFVPTHCTFLTVDVFGGDLTGKKDREESREKWGGGGGWSGLFRPFGRQQ